ncbi:MULTISPECIES: cation transporter [unclassified Corynebacterium]|uniref:cation transporter n=1 Tax=unclassified Corynebacterium TaxID=2624378 RepID=UPI0030AFBD31
MSTRERHLNSIGLRLAVFTVVYNLAEGGLSMWAGRAADLSTMIGFGLDSFIESLVAILVALRLRGRLADESLTDAKHREHNTLRAVAVTFFLLAAYLAYEGISGLLGDKDPETSVIGVGVLVASAVVMPLLWWAKLHVGKQLDDPLILADAAETKICLLMTFSSLLGLGLLHYTGWAGFDALAAFAIAGIAIMEGLEAWEGELEEDCDCH